MLWLTCVSGRSQVLASLFFKESKKYRCITLARPETLGFYQKIPVALLPLFKYWFGSYQCRYVTQKISVSVFGHDRSGSWNNTRVWNAYILWYHHKGVVSIMFLLCIGSCPPTPRRADKSEGTGGGGGSPLSKSKGTMSLDDEDVDPREPSTDTNTSMLMMPCALSLSLSLSLSLLSACFYSCVKYTYSITFSNPVVYMYSIYVSVHSFLYTCAWVQGIQIVAFVIVAAQCLQGVQSEPQAT